jgi:Flp pilus assembly pilin Flp
MTNINALAIHIMTLAADERGQGLSEYTFLLMLVAVVVVGAVTALGGKVGTLYTDVLSVL